MEHDKRKISLFSATALSATAMIGSGWLFSAQLNAKLAGNYAFLAWILAAIVVMLVAVCLSKVVIAYPVRGATTMSSALSHNGIFGMPFAFANWFGVMVCVANEAQATTQYLAAAIKDHDLMVDGILTFAGKGCAMVILVVYLLINFYGIKLLAKVNNTVTVLKIFIPLFTIAVFLIAYFDKSNFSLISNAKYGINSTLMAIVGAGLIYSYNGFQLAASFASEIKNPKRNVPLALIGSILIIMVVYMLLQLAFMGAVPHELIASSGWSNLNFHSPLLNLAMLLGLNLVGLLLVVDSVVSPSGTGYSYLGGASRMFYAMALAGQMPKWTIGELHPKYNLCRRSMLINWIMIALVLWNSDSWATLMIVVTGYNVIGYMATPISMGAIDSKTRWFGAIVISVIGLVMYSIPKADLLVINLSVLALIIIYAAVILYHRSASLVNLLILLLPMLAYLWSLYFANHYLWIIASSLIFYAIVTAKAYVAFCKKTEDHKFDSLRLVE